MKKSRFFLTSLMLMTALVFTSCGSRDDRNDAAENNARSGIEQDAGRAADDIKDGAEDLGEDIADGMDDAADDIEDAADGDRDRDGDPADDRNAARDGDVSRNTADNGTRSHAE